MIIDNNWTDFVFEKNNKLSVDKVYVRVSLTEKKNKEISKVLHLYIGRSIADYLCWDNETYIKIMCNPSYQILLSPDNTGIKVCVNKQANVVAVSKTVKNDAYKIMKSPTVDVEHEIIGQLIGKKSIVIDISKLKIK